ncbi:MAG: hypothetical protein ABIM89_18400 [Mycobacteriales bacterium]
MRTLGSLDAVIPAYGAVAIDETHIVGVRVARRASGGSILTITARGGVAAFMTQTDAPLHVLDPDHTYEVSTPVNVDPELLDALELTLLAWAVQERPVRLDWERRQSRLTSLDQGPDYLRIWPVEAGAAPIIIRKPAASLPSMERRPVLSLA